MNALLFFSYFCFKNLKKSFINIKIKIVYWEVVLLTEKQEKPVEEPKVLNPYKPDPKGRRTSQKGLDPNTLEEL